ncbi:MAG: hypothetical protein ACRENE_32655, partial [Polyangiaceae bacterium]
MRSFPLLAGSLVLSTAAGASSISAKQGPAQAKPEPGASRETGSRTVAPAVIEAAEQAARPVPGTGDLAKPSRSSPYVCPSDMAMIGRSFCIDVFEASLVQVMPDGSEKPWPYYATIPKGVVTRALSEAGVFPQGYVSGTQAAAACRQSGKRLCRPSEWRSAC